MNSPIGGDPSPKHDKSETTNSNYISALCKTPRSSSSLSISSEATLNDDTTIISEAVLPSPRVRAKAPINTNNDLEDSQILNGSVEYLYDESFAPEDFESYNDSTRYENAEWALLSYSRTNKVEKLRVLLEAKLENKKSLNLNYKGQQKKNYSWSALHLASYFGHNNIVELLLLNDKLRNEININIQNISGDTPLHKASLTNRVQIVQLLLSEGANVFIQNNDALLARQVTNNEEILRMLQAAEQNDCNRIKSDLFKAVDNGDLKTLQTYIRTLNSFDLMSPGVDEKHTENHEQEQAPAASSPLPDNDTETGTRDDLDHLRRSGEPLRDMTDERGNTLLHLAAMRGFKAICVYLLEQGLDPYKRNGLGQTCFDLSSNQLRQLFSQVKPTDNRLQRLSKQRIGRFEGPLLKKVRILGWKQIYVILENGVILLYNNKRDSRNKSRRGYKYLESATCELDKNELGVFTICFSDRSKATFAVSSDHLNYYSSLSCARFTASNNTHIHNENIFDSDTSGSNGISRACRRRDSNMAACSQQIELVRQKWLDALADHIQYSTEFIRKGLKLNDQDEDFEYCGNNVDNGNGRPIAIDQLIPIDTMKSFIHEARAHYSILDRHSELLYSLVQQINSNNNNASDGYSQSLDIINDDEICSARATSSPNSMRSSGGRQLQNSGTLVTTVTSGAPEASPRNYATGSTGSSEQTSDKYSSRSNRSASNQDAKSVASNTTSVSSTATTTSNRLFGFISKSRQARNNKNDATAPDNNNKQITPRSQVANRKTTSSIHNTSLSRYPSSQLQQQQRLANDFLQNDWPSVVFHLRLMLESASRTKNSMGHTISLMEHQEHLRQTRLHNLEERCRVLENSLLTLARDHHELEKSVSGSQFFHNPNSIARSISISTDMNEYFDAFDEFDEADRRTLTPANSTPSDESLHRRIQAVLDEDDNFIASSQAGGQRQLAQPSRSATSKLFAFANRLVASKKTTRKFSDDWSSSDGNQMSTRDDEDEDLQSNCSALTVETISEAAPNVNTNALVAIPNFRLVM